MPYVGKTVVMGFRPEDFHTDIKPAAENAITAEMTFSELLGADYNLYMNVNDVKLIVKIPATAEQPEKGMLKIAADMDKAHFFDKESENAICH